MSFLFSKIESIHQLDDFYEFVNEKMKKPQEVAFGIEERKLKEKKKSLLNVLNIVTKKIDKHKGILYGGYALNELLPKELKFYEDTEIPDYDFFVTDAETVSKEIADKLKMKNNPYTEVRYAMHDGTYKVFTNFESVADVTEISKKEYEVLLDKSIEHRINLTTSVRLAPIEFLKAVAYLELCLPIGSSFRWTKTFERLLRFEKANPLKKMNNDVTINDVFKKLELPKSLSEIHQTIKKHIKLNELVNINLNAVHMFTYLDNKKSGDLSIEKKMIIPLQVLSANIDDTVNEITRKLRAYKFEYKVKLYDDFKTFIPKKTVIKVKDKETNEYYKLISIYDATERCFAYIKRRNSRYVSIYFLMYIYYFKELVEESDENKIVLHTLYEIMANEKTHAKLINMFTDKCFGNEHTMSAIKQNRWDNKKKALFYRP
jgi:hypothetical protein